MPFIKVNKSDREVWIILYGRTFIARINSFNEVYRIVERKKYGKPPYDSWYNTQYWSAKHHRTGGDGSLSKQIIDEAMARLNAPAP